MIQRRLFCPFAILSLLLSACGGTSEAQPTAATSTTASSTTTASTTTPTSTSIKLVSTTTEDVSQSEDEEIDVVILDAAQGLAQFNTDVTVLNGASGYEVGEELSVEMALSSCSVLRSTGGADIDLLRLQGLIGNALATEFLVSPFTLEMSNYVQAFLTSAVVNVCNEEAVEVFERSQEQFAEFADGEYRFLVSLHAANNDAIWATPDADLVQLGYAICDDYPGFDANDLIEISLVALTEEDPALSLSILYAGGSGSLCPEYSDVIDEVTELLARS